jgi:hypothetical protein
MITRLKGLENYGNPITMWKDYFLFAYYLLDMVSAKKEITV